MGRLRLTAVVLTVTTACGTTTAGGGLSVEVAYSVSTVTDACLRVRASPAQPAGQTKENSLSLKGRPPTGTVRFGILIGEDWKGVVTVTATLHRPCSGPPLSTHARSAKAPASGEVVSLALAVSEVGEADGGQLDAGADAGTDAGADAGSPDSGRPDGGPGDAGAPDAGPADAGLTCDGGLSAVAGPASMNTDWYDVAPYAPGGVWLVGAGGLYWKSPSGWVSAGTGCGGLHRAGWARPDGRIYFGTDDAGLRAVDPNSGASCVDLPTPADAGRVYGIAGFVDGGTIIYSVTETGTILRQTDPDFAPLNHRWNLADAGAGRLWTIAGFDENSLFAGGANPAGNAGVIFKLNRATDTWVKQTVSAGSTVNDVSVVNGSLAYAGTEDTDLFLWEGTSWTKVSNNAFGNSIYGVKAFSPTQVYAVGNGATIRVWNGGTWTTLATFSDYLTRIRGLNTCELWAVGAAGQVVSNP